MTTMIRDIQALIFDIDDTLVPTTSHWELALDAAARRVGELAAHADPVTVARSYRHVSDDLWSDFVRNLAHLGANENIRRHVWAQALRSVDVDLSPIDLESVVNCFADTQREAIQPDQTIIDLLTMLGRRFQLAICTNGDGRLSHTKLERAGLSRLFRIIICGQDEGVRKPNPELFLRCCRALDTPPRHCMHIGDDRELDVRGALNAGIQPIWISPPVAPKEPPVLAPRFSTVADCLRALTCTI